MPGATTPPDRPVHPSDRRGGRRSRFWWAAATALAATLILTTGCSSDDEDDAASTTTAETTTTAPPSTSTTTTTTEPRTPEEEVEEAYWRAEAVTDDLLRNPDPDDERLPATRVDPSLGHIRALLESLVEDGLATQWVGGEPPPRELISIEVNGDSAVVVVCEIDNALAIDAETGEVLDDGVLSALVEVTMLQVDDAWMISSSASSAEWDDGSGCDR